MEWALLPEVSKVDVEESISVFVAVVGGLEKLWVGIDKDYISAGSGAIGKNHCNDVWRIEKKESLIALVLMRQIWRLCVYDERRGLVSMMRKGHQREDV